MYLDLYRNGRKLISVHFISILLILAAALSVNNINAAQKPANPYEQLGKELAHAITNKDAERIVKIFNTHKFAYITARTIFDKEREVSQYAKGFMQNDERALINRVFNSAFKRNGRALFLRTLNGTEPLVRIDYPSGGHEYLICSTEHVDEKLVVVDFFFLSSGKKLSVSMGAASQLLMMPSKSILKKLFDLKEVNIGLLKQFKRVGALRTKGKFKEAYASIESMPERIKKQRVIIDAAILLAQRVDEVEYRKQLALLDKYYGHDESTAFMLIDHYFYQGEHGKAQASIDRLIKKLGEDAALHNLKASIFLMWNNTTAAEKHARKAILLEPTFENGYWSLVTALVAEKRHAELVSIFQEMEKSLDHSFAPENFIANTYYQDFAQSDAYKTWFQ